MSADSSEKSIGWKAIALFALLLIWDTAAQLLFKLGVNTLGEFPTTSLVAVLHYLGRLAGNAHIMFGIGSLLLAFFTWLAIIARIDLSKAHPVSSLVYATVALASVFVLHEPFNLHQTLGVVLIVAGAYVVSEHRLT